MIKLLSFCCSFLTYICVAQLSDFKHIDFSKADKISKINKGHPLDNIGVLAYQLTHKLPTDVEKFRAIYTWVSQNISGDFRQDKKVIKRRKRFKNDSLSFVEWNSNYFKIALKRLFKNKKAVCTGYAYLIKELCIFAGIDCMLINGYGRSFASNVENLDLINHSWNAVKLNDKWYLCDATWASGYFNNKGQFVKDYVDGYFLTEPTLFAKNHYPSEKQWFLNDSLANTQFKPSPILYSETFKHQIEPLFPVDFKTFINEGETVQFRIKRLKIDSNNGMTLVRFLASEEHQLKLSDIKTKNNITSFSTIFKRKGTYDVHLKIDNDIVATYIITVLKNRKQGATQSQNQNRSLETARHAK